MNAIGNPIIEVGASASRSRFHAGVSEQAKSWQPWGLDPGWSMNAIGNPIRLSALVVL
jgi:hypothetical protein